MQQIKSSNRRAAITQRRLVNLAILGVTVGLLLVLINLLFSKNSSLIGLIIIGALVAIPACVVTVVNWRWSLYVLGFLIVFEGVARNLSNQVSVLLLKDGILALVYIGYMRENGLGFLRSKNMRRFFVGFVVVTVFCAIEVINPQIPSVLVGLIGLKTYVMYIPMLFLAYEVLDSPRKVERFVVFMLALGLASSALGAYQSFGGIEVVKQFQPGDVVSTWGSDGSFVSYKIPGSFAGPGNFSYFLQLVFALAIGLFYSKTSKWVSLFSLGCLGTFCFLLVLNSQRVAWVFIICCFLAGTFTYTTRWWLRFLRFALAALLVVAFVYAISSPDNVIGSRFSEFTQGEGVNNYLYAGPSDQIGAQLEAISKGRIFGVGTGMGAPGARYLLDSGFTFVESFLALLLYEMGPVGFFLIMGLVLLAVYDTWYAYKHSRGADHHNLVFFCLLWLVYMVITELTYAPLTIPPVAQFYWIIPGIALRISALSLKDKAAKAAGEAADPLAPPPPTERALQPLLASAGAGSGSGAGQEKGFDS